MSTGREPTDLEISPPRFSRPLRCRRSSIADHNKFDVYTSLPEAALRVALDCGLGIVTQDQHTDRRRLRHGASASKTFAPPPHRETLLATLSHSVRFAGERRSGQICRIGFAANQVISEAKPCVGPCCAYQPIYVLPAADPLATPGLGDKDATAAAVLDSTPTFRHYAPVPAFFRQSSTKTSGRFDIWHHSSSSPQPRGAAPPFCNGCSIRRAT